MVFCSIHGLSNHELIPGIVKHVDRSLRLRVF